MIKMRYLHMASFDSKQDLTYEKNELDVLNRVINPVFVEPSMSNEVKKIIDELVEAGLTNRDIKNYFMYHEFIIKHKNIKTKKQPAYVSLMGHYKHK